MNSYHNHHPHLPNFQPEGSQNGLNYVQDDSYGGGSANDEGIMDYTPSPVVNIQ